MPIWQQANPRKKTDRILNRGMWQDLPSDEAPKGAMWLLENFDITTRGPRRSGGETYLLSSSYSVDYPPIQGMAVFWKTDGTAVTVAWDKKFVYEVDPDSGFVGKYLVYDTGTVSITSGTTTVTGSGVTWSSDINAGDVIVLEPAGAAEKLIISSVDAASSQITTTTAAAATYSAVAYEIRKAFKAGKPYKVDHVLMANKLIFFDGSRYITQYDGSAYAKFSASYTDIVGCGMHFLDRLFVARTETGGTVYRTKIKWSKTTDKTDFSHGYFLDLPYTKGFARRLLPMGPLAVAYFSDAIWVGRQTGIAGDALPISFTQVGQAGLGLVGPRAVCAWQTYHYFVGTDNIYRLSNKGLDPIGTPVLSATIKSCSNPSGIYAVPDPANNRILFGFPEADDNIAKIWAFNYNKLGWSYTTTPSQMIALSAIINTKSYDDLSALTYDTVDAVYPSYDALGDLQGVKAYVIIGHDSKLLVTSSDKKTDADSMPIPAVLETLDIDEGAADNNKLWSRLSIKLDRNTSDAIIFTVRYSTNMGSTWLTAGDLTIAAGTNEGYISFKARGSTIRFRLETSSVVSSYTIAELTRRVLIRGLEMNMDN